MKPGGQPDRLYRYLLSHPGATSGEIQRALALTNATGRISDLRDEAERTHTFALVKERRPDNRWGYAVVEEEAQRTLGLNVA